MQTEKGRSSYEIPASVQGFTAEIVKIIAYMPGCEIVKLEIAMHSLFEARTLPCKPLGRVPLHGRIVSVPSAQISEAKVDISYLADWGDEFFGIVDGPITTVRLATVVPDEAGSFDVELPDFAKQADLGKASLEFILRDHASSNIVATLKPENLPRNHDNLAIEPSYAPFVLFSADTSQATPTPISSAVNEANQNK